MELGKILKLARTKRNLKLSEVADQAGISTAYLSLVETEQRHITLKVLNNLCICLGIPIPVVIYMAMKNSEIYTQGLTATPLEKALKEAASDYFRGEEK